MQRVDVGDAPYSDRYILVVSKRVSIMNTSLARSDAQGAQEKLAPMLAMMY